MRRVNEERRDVAIAWYVAALSRQDKMQPLATLLNRLEPNRAIKRQTPAEQRAALMRIAAQNGLTIRLKDS